MFAGINVLLALFVWFFIPETRKVMLEEIDTLFGGANHVDNGGKIMGVENAHHANVDAELGRLSADDKIGDVHTEHVEFTKH